MKPKSSSAQRARRKALIGGASDSALKRAELINQINRLRTESLVPIKREYRIATLRKEASPLELESILKKGKEAHKRLVKRIERMHPDYLNCAVWNSRQYKSLTAHADLLGKTNGCGCKSGVRTIFPGPPTGGNEGVLVTGTSHPCCNWYARKETIDWQNHSGLDLYPRDYNITGFEADWLGTSRFKLRYEIEGHEDNTYSDFYVSFADLNTSFTADKRGRIAFLVRGDFENAYVFGKGHDEWGTDDYGYAAAMCSCEVFRSRGGNFELIYSTRNGYPDDPYYNTSWDLLARQWGHEESWPGSVPPPHPIPDVALDIQNGSNGAYMEMRPGDVFTVCFGFLFYARTLGNDCFARIQVKDAHGHSIYGEALPLEVTLEECAD